MPPDRAAALYAKMTSDATLRQAAEMIGVEPSQLMPLPREEFELEENDRSEMIDMRMKVHERQRQKLAHEVQKQYERLVVREKRAATANTLHTSTSAPAFPMSAKSSTPLSAAQLTRAKAKADERRLQLLATRREAPSNQWFENQYRKAEQRQEKAQRRHERFLDEHVVAHARNTLKKQHLAHSRSYAAVMQAEQEADKALQHLEKRMERAADLKARSDEHRNNEMRKQREREEKRQTLHSKTLEKLERSEERRVANLHKRFGREDAVMRQLQRKRELELELIRERNRLLTASREESLQRQEMARQRALAEIEERHEATMERVNRALDKKQAELEERKAASLRSSYERQTIILNSRGESVNPIIAEANSRWEQRLRWIPLPAAQSSKKKPNS